VFTGVRGCGGCLTCRRRAKLNATVISLIERSARDCNAAQSSEMVNRRLKKSRYRVVGVSKVLCDLIGVRGRLGRKWQ